MTSVERWLPIPGWEGLYEASSLGRIKSCSRTVMRRNGTSYSVSERILNPSKQESGHLRVPLSSPGRPRTREYVHRLVAEAFHGAPEPGQEVRHHPDPDPANNRPENLIWGTRIENVADMLADTGHFRWGQTRCKREHEFTPENTLIDRKGRRVCRACRRENYARRSH